MAEKPSVARDLARVIGAGKKEDGYLEGPGVRVTWCVGHLAELEDPAHYDAKWRTWSFDTLPMVPAKFDLRLRSGDVKDQFRVIERLMRAREVKEVVNACDAGREGELIFRYVYELAGCKKPVLRLWTSSLTDEAISNAWDRLEPAAKYDALGDAARCRSEADWLVGLNATRALTCLARKGGGEQLLSVGRVQTPTLAMIVARDQEIEAFVPTAYWLVKAQFVAAGGAWEATWFRRKGAEPKPDAERRDDDEAPAPERVEDAATAQAIVDATRGRTGVVSEADRKRTREQPPLLYDLTSLQRRANERYGLSAPQTLEIAQALYERHKLITYPRTDARHLTPDQVATLPGIVRGLAGVPVYAPFANALLAKPIQPGKRVVDAAEVGDHHAILPTGKTPDGNRLTADEKKVFDLVARRLMAALSPDALFDVTTLIVAVDPGAPLPAHVAAPLEYRARGRVCREAGWRAVDPPGKSRDVDLPPVERGDAAAVKDVRSVEEKTRPPRPYTDATLLRAMETAGKELDDEGLRRAMRQAGLGTPATRAEILETLVRREYVRREQRDLRATDRGRALIAAVPVAELKSAELTGRWEARLAAVAERKDDRPSFMGAVAEHVRGVVRAIEAAEPPPPEVREKKADGKPLGACPVCGTPVREGPKAFSCETGRACVFVVFKTIAKRKISARMVQQLLKDGKTEVVKGFKSKAGKEFQAALAWKDGRVSFDFPPREEAPRSEDPTPPEAAVSAPQTDPVGLACPKCRDGRIVRGRTAWGCDRWKDGCRYLVPFEVDGHRVSEAEAVDRIRTGN